MTEWNNFRQDWQEHIPKHPQIGRQTFRIGCENW